MTIKRLFGFILQFIIALCSFFVVKEFITIGGNYTASEVIVELLIILGVVSAIGTFVSDNLSFKDAMIGTVVWIVILSALMGLKSSDKATLSSWLFAIFMLSVGFYFLPYNLGCLKGSLKIQNQRLASLGVVFANLFEVISGIVMVLILVNVVKDDTYSLITTIMVVGLIIACVTIVGGVVLVLIKHGIRKTKGTNKKVTSSSNTNVDTRKKDLSSFSSILYDELNSVARSYSGNKSLTNGSVNLSIRVNINNSNILFIIDGKLHATDVKTQYDANDFNSSLKRELESIANSLLSEANSKIEKVRKKYQNYDGEYKIDVRTGNIN